MKQTTDRYIVVELKKACTQFLVKNLPPERACEILTLANQHGDEGLKEDVIAFILDKKIPLQDELWTGFCTSHPVLANKVLTRFYKILSSR